MNRLTMRHQDGDLTYHLVRGGFAVDAGAITVSVETVALTSNQSPDCALFALSDAPIIGELRAGMVLEARSIAGERVEGDGAATAYFTFHAEDVSLRWTVREVAPDHVVFALDAVHDDVNYYDERARPTTTAGLFTLSRRSRDELWAPV